MAQQQGPRNVEGEEPTGTPAEVAERLWAKMRDLRGEANRRRAAAEAGRVLLARSALTRPSEQARTPRNEEEEAPTRSAQETAERLAEKLRQQHGGANRRRIAAKIGTV